MAKVVINSKTVAAYLAGEFGVAALLDEKIAVVLNNAISNAPVATGEYRDSIHVETVKHPSRIVKRVVADSSHAMNVEANTGNLSRALRG